jgi:effector-binding domain-containing protein
MSKIIPIIIAAAIVIIGIICIVLFSAPQGKPEVLKTDELGYPRIKTLPAQKMIEASVKGKPDQVLPVAFDALFKTYFAMSETPKGKQPPAPRLRMAIPETDKTFQGGVIGTLEVTVGLPIPETITSLPAVTDNNGVTVKISTWEYGSVAEIQHIGPYDKEPPTIQKLLDYIKAQGYAPAGIHEEEYIAGPGMPGVNPDQYVTVIRYPVKKIVQ